MKNPLCEEPSCQLDDSAGPAVVLAAKAKERALQLLPHDSTMLESLRFRDLYCCFADKLYYHITKSALIQSTTCQCSRLSPMGAFQS